MKNLIIYFINWFKNASDDAQFWTVFAPLFLIGWIFWASVLPPPFILDLIVGGILGALIAVCIILIGLLARVAYKASKPKVIHHYQSRNKYIKFVTDIWNGERKYEDKC